MREKFRKEVAVLVEGGTLGPYKWAGAASYGKPVMIIGQAFHDTDPVLTWGRMPTPTQLSWWYDLAVRVDAEGMGWFCRRSAPGVDGLDKHPAHQRMVDALWKSN
jgi:hypothetical protein